MLLNYYTNVFLSIALLIVILTVVLYSRENYNDFLDNNQQLSNRSVDGTSREIEFFINEKKRYVNLFSEQEKMLLTHLISNPENSLANKMLADKINVYFPNRFSFTVTNNIGKPILVQGKDLIGKACRDDISLFSTGANQNMIYVHPSPKTSRQHYDVMSSIKSETGVPSVLFVSFFLDDVLRIMKHGTINNHHLFLLKRGKPTVVEVATQNALDVFRSNGHHFELTPSVKENEFSYIWPQSLDKLITATGDVAGTHWQLVGVIEPKLMNDYVTRMLYQATGILLLFVIITLAGFWLSKKLGILSGDTRTVINSVEQERRRVAMDLHDQVLTDISHLRRDCRNRCEPNNSKISVSHIDQNLEHITNTIRHIIDDLHPQSIEILGLAETICSYCKKHFQQTSMCVNMTTKNYTERKLNQAEKLHIFRIFQEVIHNAGKHSNASQCDVKLEMTALKLILSVTDNGIGMPIKKPTDDKGRGLRNIASRSRIIHAKSSWHKTQQGTAFLLVLGLR